MAKGLDIVVVAEATAEHPRNSEASVAELKDGRLLLAWMEYVGSELLGHDEAPSNIASVISSDGGKTWKDHRILVERDPADVNVYSPSLLRLKNGEILLSFFVYHSLRGGSPINSSGFVLRTKDEGETFSSPISVWRNKPYGYPNNTLIQLSSGRIIFPIGKQVGLVWSPTDHEVLSCLISDDDGYSWMEPTSWVDLPMRGAMEPHVVELEDGRLLMYMRTQLGAIFQSDSKDGGVTWSKPQTTGLKAPESMPCLTKIPRTGDLLLVWNHSMYDPGFDHYGKRTPLTVAISKDEGQTWENFKNIESDPNWEFTNPSCNFTSQDRAIITYLASPMAIPHPPGRLGRSRMSLKAAIADIDWFYKE